MFKTPSKLEAYTWVTNDGRVDRMPMEYAFTSAMPDRPVHVDDDDNQLSLLQVVR